MRNRSGERVARRRSLAMTVACAGMIAVTFSLAGCIATPSTPAPTESIAVSTPTPTPTITATPTPSAPQFLPNGSAQENLPYFDAVNRRVLQVNPSAVGADFINALIAAGFARADMQVTADRTSVNLPAGSIQFSVKIQGKCLIGQNGAGSDGYHSEVTPPLATGKCLVGDTVPIG